MGKVEDVKRILLLGLTAAALLAPAGAHAAVPCRDKIYNEWYATGKISTTYPIACYQDALKNVPTDAKIYSNLGGDIKAAMQAAIAGNDRPSSGGGSAPAPTTSTGPHQVKGASKTKVTAPPKSTDAKLRPEHLSVAPLASTSSGNGVPTPILILGALAILLALAGLVGAGLQNVRKRRAV
jgi:hypothetical protein